MNYKELFSDISNHTDDFSLESGTYTAATRAEIIEAEDILSLFYENVKRRLDYANKSVDGADYMIEFDTPLIGDINESKKKMKDIKFTPDLSPSNASLVNNGFGSFGESIEKHKELNKDLFEDDELKEEVKEKLLYIADVFKNNLLENEVELDIKDIVLVGSNVSYNYTADSDIDMHIIADISEYDEEDLVQKLYTAYKTLFNSKYDPVIYGHDVEVYVEFTPTKKSNGIYSLYTGWVKKPDPDLIPEVDQERIDKLVKPYVDKAKKVKTGVEAQELIDELYKLRISAMLKSGSEYDDKNLIFKEMRNLGYLKKLKDLVVEEENKKMSLNETLTTNDVISELNRLLKEEEDAINSYDSTLEKLYEDKETYAYAIEMLEHIRDEEKEHMEELNSLLESSHDMINEGKFKDLMHKVGDVMKDFLTIDYEETVYDFSEYANQLKSIMKDYDNTFDAAHACVEWLVKVAFDKEAQELCQTQDGYELLMDKLEEFAQKQGIETEKQKDWRETKDAAKQFVKDVFAKDESLDESFIYYAK